MEGLRSFERGDIPQAVALHERVFGTTSAFSSASLASYFDEVFFNNPWYDASLPSFVYAGEQGRIRGFLGVVPRPMLHRGRRLKVAVSTQLMVEPGAAVGVVAVRLIRAFFAGPQELSFSDGANEKARRLWVGAGGTASLLHSLHWTRPVRLTRFVRTYLERRRAIGPLALAVRPFEALADGVLARSRSNQFHRDSSDTQERELTADEMFAHLPEMLGRRPLQPMYDRQSLAWLLDQVRRKTHHGPCRARSVIDGHGRLIGWYIYYVNAGGESEILHIAAREGQFDYVLQRLLIDAWRRKVVAVNGRLDPPYVQELSDRHCMLRREGPWTLFHTRDPELAATILSGDAALSRLDGEWWMRFLNG